MTKSVENGKHSINIQFFTFFTYAFCITGFAWLCWGQIEKFLSRKTTVTVSWNKSQKLNFPLVVFCAHHSYTDEQNSPSFISEELMDNYAAPTNISVIGVYLGELNFIAAVNYSVKYLYTNYNGRCQAFTFQEEYPPKSYVTFSTTEDQPLVAFFMEPGNELLLIWQIWFGQIVSTIVIESDNMIEFSRSTHTYLNKADRPCKDYSQSDFMKCISEEIKVSFNKNNLTCIPSSFADLLNYKDSRPRNCTPKDYLSITSATNITINSLMHYTGRVVAGYEGKCSWPCTRQSIEAQNARLSAAAASEDKEDVWIMYLAYSTDLEVVSEEFYLYDTNVIISSVGGGLGMFLGVSCFGIMSKMTQSFLIKLQ